MKRRTVVFCSLCLAMLCVSCRRAVEPPPGPTPTPSAPTQSIMPTDTPTAPEPTPSGMTAPTPPPPPAETAEVSLPMPTPTPPGEGEDNLYLNLVREALERGKGPDLIKNTVDPDTLTLDSIYSPDHNDMTYVYGVGTADGHPTFWTFDLVKTPDGTWRVDRWYAALTDKEFFESPLGFPLGQTRPWDFTPLGEPLVENGFSFEGVDVQFYVEPGTLWGFNEMETLSEHDLNFKVQLTGFVLTGPKYPTARGVRVGDGLEALLSAYPSSRAETTNSYTYRPPFPEYIGEMEVTLDGGAVITKIEYRYNIN